MDRTVILAADRRARCAVEVPANPEPAERTAGEELAHYIGKLAGTPIGLHQGETSGAPVRILVGGRAREEAGDLPVDEVRDDGFVLRVSPDRIALAGANTRGTLYAAYELIERLGVWWYGPDPEDEYVPPAGDPALGLGSEVVNPSFRFRFLRCLFSAMVGLEASGMWQPFSSPRREQLLDWGVKNRLNAGQWPFDDPDVTSFFARRGGVACVDHAHALPYMVPPDEYWESHPGYFAVDEHGELFERRANEYGMHVCTSNPDVFDLVLQKVREARDAETSDDVQGRLDVIAAQVEYGDRLMGARRTAETYHRTRDRDHLKRLVRERDAIVEYIAANPVDGAYHLGGIGGKRGNINNFLLGHLWGIDRI